MINKANECVQGIGDMTDVIAMILLPLAVLMCAYAMVVFLWRGSRIAQKQACAVLLVPRGSSCLASHTTQALL